MIHEKKKKKGKTKQKRKIKRKKRKKKFNSFHTRISNSGSASPGQLDELIEKSKSGARESWKQRENVMKFGVNVAAIIGHVTSVGRAREPLPLSSQPSPLLSSQLSRNQRALSKVNEHTRRPAH